MAPRTRLSLSIVALVGVVAVLLSVLSLYALAEAKFEEALEIARVTSEQVKVYLVQRVSERAAVAPGAGIEEAQSAWRQVVRDDPQLSNYLVSAIAGSRSVVEILVTDGGGTVLATSNPGRLDRPVEPLPDLESWSQQAPWQKLLQVLAPARDLELSVPLGAGGSTDPVFVVRVIVSTALIRNAVIPQVQSLALLSLLCLVVASGLSWLLSNIAARPLERISEMIDLIAKGGSSALPAPLPPDRELASLHSKLALLGEQVRDASQDASQLRGNVERMLERLQDAVFLFGPDNNLVMASKAAERFLGLGRWEVIGQELGAVFRDDTPLGALVQSAARLGQPVHDHLIDVARPDGGLMHVLVTVELIEDFPDRRRLGTIVNLRDAESRRQLESELGSSYQREAFGRLLQGVAHEIKNPLNAIYTHLQLLQIRLGDGDAETKEQMGVIGREIKTLDRMVKTLLDFTRPLEVTLAETDLVAMAAEIAALLKPRAAEKQIEIALRHEQPEVIVSADRTILRQAVMNVAVNAIECMKKPGRVVVAVSSDGGTATLAVSDEGPGIPEEVQAKIFNLYFTTKGKRGSGIGLAMSYRIAQLHNVALEFTTEPERGTTFRFVFPPR